MKTVWALILLVSSSFAQTISLSGGVTSSKLDWRIDNSHYHYLDDRTPGYSAFVGVDYYYIRFFNLSSHIGFVQKGGEQTDRKIDNNGNDVGTFTIKGRLNYLSLNTVGIFRYELARGFSPFVGVGPRLDVLLSHNKLLDQLEESEDLNEVSLGFTLQTGVMYKLSRYEFSVKGEYHLNLNKIAKFPKGPNNSGGSVNDGTGIVSLVIGYKL